MSKSKVSPKFYKFYFNFPTANRNGLLRYYVHRTDHKEINIVGSSRNGLMVDDFETIDDLLKALKKLIKKFRDKEKRYEIVYCERCFPDKK